MNFVNAEKEIRQFFNTAWITAYPSNTPEIAWPDVDFTIPDNETWVRFNCQESDGRQVSIGSPGSNRFRQFGIVTIQIFQPQGQGSADARAKAQTALEAFKGGVTDGGVHFYNVFGRQVGNDENGFYQINVVVGFWYDDIT